MENISITIPLTISALGRTCTMLQGLANDIVSAPALTVESDVDPVPNVAPVVVEVPQPEPTPPVIGVTSADGGIPSTDKPDPASLDKDGIPWDRRIHGASQLRLVKGDTWKLIKGIEKKSPGLVDQVKAELLAAQEAIRGTQPVEAAPVTAAPSTPVTAAPSAPVVASLVPPATVTPFMALMSKTTPRVLAHPEYKDIIQAVLTEFKFTQGMPQLNQFPELIPAFDQALEARYVAQWQD